jgi:Short C-terminal domain
MFMRRRRPLMRAAMVGGTAYYAGKRMEERREREAEQEYRLQALETEQAPERAAPTPTAGGGVTSDALAKLEQLAALKERGVLNEDEFEVQKRRLLGTS